MPSFLRVFSSITLLSLGCSGAEFDIASTSDAATRADSANKVADTGAPGSDDGVTSSEAGAPDAPPLDCKTPPMTCASTGDYVPHHDLAPTGPLAVAITPENKHMVSFLTSRRGRIEKIGLRLRRNENIAGVDGDFTVSAFFMPCEGTLIPIGKHTKSAAEVSGDTTFYFNPDSTGGLVPFLPFAEKGTRIAFVIETTSTRYHWTMQTATIPSGNELGHAWATKTGAMPWKVAPQIAATMSYIRACGT